MKINFFIILFIGIALSEVDINFSYELKYGNGKQTTIQQNTSDYSYFENLLDINTTFGENFYLYTQLEYSDPPVFGEKHNKLNQIISNIFLEYENDKLNLKLGDLNELYGRGLACYTMLDQNVDYSNLLQGFSSNYFITDDLKASLLYGIGEIRFRSNPSLREANLSVNTSAFISSFEYINDRIGLINYNYLNQKNEIDPISLSVFDGKTEIHDDIDQRLSSDDHLFDRFMSYLNGQYIKDTVVVNNHNLNWNFYIGPFDIYIDKAWINYQKIYGNNIFGSRFYSSIYTDFFDIGITYEYKNYNTPYLVKTLANPPIVYREGTSILASRNAHAFNFGNEIGHQIDINRNFNGINLVANFSISRKRKEDNIVDYNLSKFISMKEDSILSLYDPFRQVYFETNGWLFSENLYFKLASDFFVELLDQKYTSAITFPTQWVLKRNSGNSFTMYFELQNKIVKQFDQSFIVTSEKKYFNQYLSISFNRLGKWIITGFFDQEIAKNEAQKWPGVDFSYNINEKTQFSLFYGSQKGGLVCANGICAEQPSFEDGFKITLRSIF